MMLTLKNVRRKMFDENQHTVMNLKVGEISPVLYDDGYYIYRMDTKSMLPLERVKGEIHKQFQGSGEAGQRGHRARGYGHL